MEIIWSKRASRKMAFFCCGYLERWLGFLFKQGGLGVDRPLWHVFICRKSWITSLTRPHRRFSISCMRWIRRHTLGFISKVFSPWPLACKLVSLVGQFEYFEIFLRKLYFSFVSYLVVNDAKEGIHFLRALSKVSSSSLAPRLQKRKTRKYSSAFLIIS